MESQALSATGMRIIIFIIGLVVLALIYWFGKPRKPQQGKRGVSRHTPRVEPTLGEADANEPATHSGDWPTLDTPEQGDLLAHADAPGAHDGNHAVYATQRSSNAGKRPPQQPLDRIITLYVTSRLAGMLFRGSDLVVAAEKAGLEFGDMNIFHRLVDGKPELGPIFSAANMLKPGQFDMRAIATLETPGLSLFMTLPGPLPALDAWDAMLPTAQRLAELLDGLVVDEQRNALGRQRIAYIRDELRAWDREHGDGDN